MRDTPPLPPTAGFAAAAAAAAAAATFPIWYFVSRTVPQPTAADSHNSLPARYQLELSSVTTI